MPAVVEIILNKREAGDFEMKRSASPARIIDVLKAQNQDRSSLQPGVEDFNGTHRPVRQPVLKLSLLEHQPTANLCLVDRSTQENISLVRDVILDAVKEFESSTGRRDDLLAGMVNAVRSDKMGAGLTGIKRASTEGSTVRMRGVRWRAAHQYRENSGIH